MKVHNCPFCDELIVANVNIYHRLISAIGGSQNTNEQQRHLLLLIIGKPEIAQRLGVGGDPEKIRHAAFVACKKFHELDAEQAVVELWALAQKLHEQLLRETSNHAFLYYQVK